MVVLSADKPQVTALPIKAAYLNGAPTNGVSTNGVTSNGTSVRQHSTLLATFLSSQQELEDYSTGVQPIIADGHQLSISAITAAARYGAPVALDESPSARQRLERNRKVVQDKIDAGTSVYGVSTGFGGSADTRTKEHLALGHALLQHQHAGVLPSSRSLSAPGPLPLSDPIASTSMPESWVRAAILVRTNTLIRGHSGVRWELLEKMSTLLRENIIPLVPLRGSISASGDLSPLSYIAGTVVGNPSIRVFDSPSGPSGPRQIVSSLQALRSHSVTALPLLPKEQLGILNGTAFSAAVASLALNDAVHLAVLAQICTAMGTEALLGTRASFVPFIHDVARPHPGQIEVAKVIYHLLEGSQFATAAKHEEVTVDEDQGTLRQDRYPLRTAPQFLGPQVEDILSAVKAVTLESNSTTDNPLFETETGIAHHGGNFQAMAVSNAMEKTRLALHHIGKILFSQSTELNNPTMNRGLPPNLAATDPSVDYHTKGVDIATAAYVSELGFLANPVSTHIQSAEMHNQAINSLALISARATINSLEVLSMLTSSYLYTLCQALDIRALQAEFKSGLENITTEELSYFFGAHLSPEHLQNSPKSLLSTVLFTINTSLDTTTTMDAVSRMRAVLTQTAPILLDFFVENSLPSQLYAFILEFRERVASRGATLLQELRQAYLSGDRGPAPASPFLNKTRPVYEFVRCTLGIRMHGAENYEKFPEGLGVTEQTIGQNISLIHESIRDGQMQKVVAGLLMH